MKKRVMGLIFGLIGVILLVNLVVASDVGYIIKNSRSVDSGFMKVFDEMGLSVDVIESRDIKGMDFSEYKFMFIGDERLKNIKYIPIDDVPSVIANKYYGEEFGLVDKRKISKLSSNAELKVKSLGVIVQVYDRAKFKFRGLGVPYYYLSDRYKNKNMQGVAIPNVKSKQELGDVIAYSSSGVNKCFFGITKTKYWTAESKDLFKDCIGFVVNGVEEPLEPEPECVVDLDCGVVSSELFCEASSLVNRITTPSCIDGVCVEVIIDDIQYCEYGCADGVCLVETFDCIFDEDCGTDYYLGNYCLDENVVKDLHDFICLGGECVENIIPESIEGCLFGCVEGVCLEDIPECVEDSACGADSYSENYCSLEGNVVKDFHNIGCVVGGCVDNIIQELVETCYFGCLDGVCLLEFINEKHDVQLIDDYDGFGNEIRIRDFDNNVLEEEVPQLYCGEGYDFHFKTKNVGDFVEDLVIVLRIRNQGNIVLENVKTKDGLIAGGETTVGNKDNFVFNDVVSGSYSVSVLSSISGFIDDNLEDNFATREIEIICGS